MLLADDQGTPGDDQPQARLHREPPDATLPDPPLVDQRRVPPT